MAISKRKSKTVISKTNIDVETIYCRKCMQYKKPTDFYIATDFFLDANGFYSICKICCQEIYNGFYLSEKSIERALLKTCRLLNLKYDQKAIDAAKQHMNTQEINGVNADNFFGRYKSKLLISTDTCIQSDRSNVDLTFYEPSEIPDPINPLDDHEKNAVELKQFWGDKFEREEYDWLETEYSNWKATNPPANRNEETILKLVVLKILSIRKEINLGKDTSKLEEGLTKLMNAGALNPVQANAASQGKIKDSLGMWIKDIEKYQPAEWWKDNSIYKDIDNVAEYWKTHILRPFLNFWGVQKDFSFEGAVETFIDEDEVSEEKSQSEV